jgi:protein O-mannosyl-transferase
MRERLLLLAGALAAFGASLGSGFHFDDYAIFSDSALRSVWGWLEIWRLQQTRPLTYLTFWLNYQVGGRDPLGYHLLNLALHLAVVLLVFECLRKMVPERAAWIAAALFAVHPIQAEAVDYIWGRSIMLAALFCAVSLWAWLEGRRWMAVLWFGLALLAKEECAAFPLVLGLLEWRRASAGNAKLRGLATDERGSTRIKKAVASPIAAMIGLAFAAAARVVYATAVTPGAPAGLRAGISPWKYFLAQGVAIPRYLRLLVVPYGFTVDPEIHVPPVWLGVLAWLCILGAAAWLWKRNLWLVAGLVLLLPSSSIFPAADLAADRRMYLPLIALATGAGLWLAKVQWRPLGAVLAAALCLVGVSRTYVWMSDARLWGEAVRRAPDKIRPKIQLSRAVPASAALELLTRAAIQSPYDPAVAAETGRVFLEEHQPEAALREFGRALALEPRNPQNLNNRGVALEELGQIEAARMDFESALALDPGFAEARENLEKITEPAR